MRMKKFFTLIAMALVAVGANAFKDTWKSTSSSTSPVSTANVKVTFNDLTDDSGTHTWTFSNSYAVGAVNGQTVTIEPTASGNLTIIFGGSVSTNKKLHMQDADGTGLTATLASNQTVTIADNESPTADIASNDGVIYALEAGKTYTFSVSGTKWRFASYVYTNEKEIAYSTEWNFSNWATASGFTNQVKENLGFLASYQDAESQITNFAAIATSNKGGYTKCLKMGGNGSPLEGTGTPTQRFLYFNVNGDADIYVHCVAGGDGERYLVLSDGTTELARELTSKNLTEVKYSYTGAAGIICLYSVGGSVNIYDIKANNVGSTVKLDDEKKPTGIQAIKTLKTSNNAAVYNLAGQKVSNNFKGIAIQNGRKVVIK